MLRKVLAFEFQDLDSVIGARPVYDWARKTQRNEAGFFHYRVPGPDHHTLRAAGRKLDAHLAHHDAGGRATEYTGRGSIRQAPD